MLSESTGALRSDTLKSMIDQQVFVLEGKRLGLMVSASAARTYMQGVVSHIQGLQPADPARVQFEAFLCIRHLSTATFLTDPATVQSYQDVLTVTAVRSHYLDGLAPAQTSGQAGVQPAFATYEQQLWQSYHVRILLPASLLS